LDIAQTVYTGTDLIWPGNSYNTLCPGGETKSYAIPWRDKEYRYSLREFVFRELERLLEKIVARSDYTDPGVFIASSIFPLSKTRTKEIRSYYDNLEAILSLMSYIMELEKEDLEQAALLRIAANYAKIRKVKSIYAQKFREEIQVYILITSDRYDGSLMDQLLDIEYEIRKIYSSLIFEFFYPPVFISDKTDFIHPQAQCIFAR
jgi:hypothetical protein